jgi:predicted transcriptional regulator
LLASNTTLVVMSLFMKMKACKMREKRVFGELELMILKIFIRREKLTVREVQEELGGDDKYTTIMTVMNRLVEKQQLNRRRIGQQYEYWVNQAINTVPKGLLEKLKQKIFGGKSVSMISFLIESSQDITDSELAEMEKLIQQKKKGGKLES